MSTPAGISVLVDRLLSVDDQSEHVVVRDGANRQRIVFFGRMGDPMSPLLSCVAYRANPSLRGVKIVMIAALASLVSVCPVSAPDWGSQTIADNNVEIIGSPSCVSWGG